MKEFYVDNKLVAAYRTSAYRDTQCAKCEKKIYAGKDYYHVGILTHVHIECADYDSEGKWLPPNKQ